MTNFTDITIKIGIAYGILMIIGLLIYIAFYKKDSGRQK